MLKARIFDDALDFLNDFFASILLLKDRIIMDDVKSNTSDKGHHKF